MTESSAQYPEPVRSSLHAPPLSDSAFPTPVTAAEASAARPPKSVRCRHCRRVASAELTICPGCGRELKPAPPLFVTWGGPVVITIVALLMIVPVVGAIKPGRWLRSQFSSGLSMAVNFGEQLEPEVVIVMTPIAAEAVEETAKEPAVEVAAAAPAAADGEPQVVALASTEAPALVLPMPTETALPTPVSTEVIVATAVVVDTALPTATPAPTETPVATPSPTPTETSTPVPAGVASGAGVAAQVEQQPTTVAASASALPTPTWTALPTATAAVLLPTATPSTGIGGAVGAIAAVAPVESGAPTETPTNTPTDSPTFTPTPQAYQVKRGDTLVTIAARYGVTVEAIMAANGIAARDVYVIQPGQLLIIPTATPTPGPTPEPVLYSVRPGDTLVSIAAKYGISTRALMAANGIAGQDVYVLQPGQELTIPAADAPVATDTPVVAPTATAVSVATAAADSAIRLDAPVLVGPETGTPLSCSGQAALNWNRVQFIRDDDKYILHLGFVSGRQENGEDMVTWVLAQPRPATQTSWDLDVSLCGLAAQSFGRQWRWWVEVVAEVEGQTVSVSPPSPVWGFSWN